MKKIISLIVLGVIASQVSFASLRWGNGSDVILNELGNPVPTSSEEVAPFIPLDPTVGAFAQLIRILVGATPYDFVNSGSGISVGNEQVVETMYSGQHDDLLETEGAFNFTSVPILNGSQFDGIYYVRVFNAPQATVEAFNLGNAAPIPSGATYYWQSATYNYVHNDLSPSVFNFGPGQTLNAVPEPGTVLLMAMGLVGLFVHRRRAA